MAVPNPNDVDSSQIVKDATAGNWKGTPAVVVSGYLEKPDPAQHLRWRLYRTLAMDEYMEFEWNSVIHIHNYNPTAGGGPADPLTHVLIWLTPSAYVSMGDFLVGEVADMFMPHEDMAAMSGVRGRAGAILNVAGSRAGCTMTPACGGAY